MEKSLHNLCLIVLNDHRPAIENTFPAIPIVNDYQLPGALNWHAFKGRQVAGRPIGIELVETASCLPERWNVCAVRGMSCEARRA